MSGVVVVILIVAAFAEGLVIGYALRCRFLAQGFRIMQEQADDKGIGLASANEPLFSASDISRAFGSLRDEANA